MSDLISRKALIEFINSVPYMIEHDNLRTIFINWIEQQPAAIVYCKECTLYGHCFAADVFDFTGYERGFCAAGKKGR